MQSPALLVQRPNHPLSNPAPDVDVAPRQLPTDVEYGMVPERVDRPDAESLEHRMAYAMLEAEMGRELTDSVTLPDRFSQDNELPLCITATSPYLPNPTIARIMPTHPSEPMFIQLQREARRVPSQDVDAFYQPACPLIPRVQGTDESHNVGLEYWRYDDKTEPKAELMTVYQQNLAPIDAGPSPITNVLVNLMDMQEHMRGGPLTNIPAAHVCTHCYEADEHQYDVAFLLMPCKHAACTECWKPMNGVVGTKENVQCKLCGTPVLSYSYIHIPPPEVEAR